MARKKKIEEAPLEITYIYHPGDNIQEIAKAMTGHEYMMNRLLEYNEKSYHDLKDGDILKWSI